MNSLNHKGTQTLQSERLTLRRFNINDAQAMFDNWASSPKVTEYLSWEPHESIEETKRILEEWTNNYNNLNTYHWAIVYQDNVIGSIGPVRMSERNHHCEIGYCIGDNYWNIGLMTEALRCVLKYLFEEINFHYIMARHDVNNMASGRVMEKSGMKLEGIMRESHYRRDGTYGDLKIYGILDREFN